MRSRRDRKSESPQIAMLFWFYKRPEVCRNHLELLRRSNPNCLIYGLYGGPSSEIAVYGELLGDLLNDFWVYPDTYVSERHEKWIHGDLLLLDWYDKRGRHLPWDSIAVIQWDVLLFTDIAEILPGLRRGQVFFSGYRTLTESLEAVWQWSRPGDEGREDYLEFVRYVDSEFGFTQRPKCCQFVFEVLTREFFDRYLEVTDRTVGMIEYRVPTMAAIFGLDVVEYDVGMRWYWDGMDQSLNAGGPEIEPAYIRAELEKADGWRMFHPFTEDWPEDEIARPRRARRRWFRH